MKETLERLLPKLNLSLTSAQLDTLARFGSLLLEKNPHVRIVSTAVTLESVGALAARMADFEKAECVSLQAARARTAGSYHLMQGQNPVYIFTMQNRREQA